MTQTLSARLNVGVAQIVVPGTSSGLVSASGLTGNTTGSAISAGFVGEKITATLAGVIQVNPVAGTYYDDSGTLPLTAGVWMVCCSAGLAMENATTGTVSNQVPVGYVALRTGSTLVQEQFGCGGHSTAATSGGNFELIGAATIMAIVSNVGSVTYKMSTRWGMFSGSSSTIGTLYTSSGYLYAIRIA